MIDSIIDTIANYLVAPFVAIGYFSRQLKSIIYIFILALPIGISAHYGFGLAFFKSTMMAFGVLTAIYSISFVIRVRE